jgi:hypothetical protein
MTRRALWAGVLGGLLLGLAAAGVAAKDAEESVRWRRTYGEALLEARLRNLPVLVTRHKDT